MTKRFGFTLAEVLITLGIIGVVAAMTMPTLMNSTRGAQYKTAYKKALSVISQAVTLNMALDDYNFSTATGGGMADNTSTPADGSVAAIIKNRTNVVRTVVGPLATTEHYGAIDPGANGTNTTSVAPTANNYTFFFNDGTMFTFNSQAANCTLDATNGQTRAQLTNCKGYIDVNGTKAPNKVVKCDGTTAATDENCRVTNPTDIYPVIFYDQFVVPNSVAARTTLYAK